MRSRPIWTGSASRPTWSCASRTGSRSTMPRPSGCRRSAGSIPATRRRRSSNSAASASSPAACRRSTTGRPSSSRTRTGAKLEAGGAPAPLALPARSRRTSPGTTSCAAIATWIAARSPIRCWCARTATYLYTLPSVVDDIELSDHPCDPRRGPRHQHGGADPDLRGARRASRRPSRHHNLLTTASGEGLSKRLGHLSIKGLREAGLEPQAVASLAVLVGSAEAVRPVADLDELARLIDFSHISRAPAKFDEQRARAPQRPPHPRDAL